MWRFETKMQWIGRAITCGCVLGIAALLVQTQPINRKMTDAAVTASAELTSVPSGNILNSPQSQLPFPMPIPPILDIPDLDSILGDLLKGEPPISTSLEDAVTEVPFLDEFDPDIITPLTVLERAPNGDYLLQPGLFKLNAQSYCLHAGTYAPGRGEGYLYTPLKGSRAEVIRNILRRSLDHPEVPQQDIQVLIWAILARTKIADMSSDMQRTANSLLTSDEIFDLNGGALGLIPDQVMQEAIAQLPDPVQQTLRAEAQLRSMLTSGNAAYQELERVAVLVGEPPVADEREVPRGRWSYHPDGYFIRYFPSGYALTRVEIYVPEPIQIERDPLGRITLIADQAGNRIEAGYDDAIAPLTIPGDPNVKGYAFRFVRFTQIRQATEKRLTHRAEWQNVGWTMVGNPSGEGVVGPVNNRFTGLAPRYDIAFTNNKQLEKLDPSFEDSGKTEIIMALDHFVTALSEVVKAESTESSRWNAEYLTLIRHIDLARKAWQNEVCKSIGSCQWKNASSRYYSMHSEPHIANLHWEIASTDPIAYLLSNNNNDDEMPKYGSDGVATPGNTARQRLAQSGRSADTDDNDCDEVEAWLQNEILALLAYGDQDLVANSANGSDYDNAIGGTTEPFDYGVNASTCEYQVDDHVTGWKINYENEAGLRAYLEANLKMPDGRPVPDAVIDAIMDHERTHMRQCRDPATSAEFKSRSPEAQSTFETEAYCKSAKSLWDYMINNCGGSGLPAHEINYLSSRCLMHW